MMTAESKHQIRSVVGPENALDSEIDRFGYSYDSSFVPLSQENRPELVVRPLTTAEVAKVMAIADDQGIPVTPRGAASGRTGGSVPLQGGISLCLDRMTRIVELDEGNMMVTAEAGVRTIDLYNHCAAKGFFYPPDPGSWKYSTIGGNVAENAGGMRAVKYGVTSNYVMGLEVVLADGTILQTGGKALKNVTGYDLKSLFTGSEGTLGIITAALLRLIPMPKQRGTIQILFGSLDEGCQTVHRMLAEGVVPASAEIMDRLCLDAVAKLGKQTFPPDVQGLSRHRDRRRRRSGSGRPGATDRNPVQGLRGGDLSCCPIRAGVRRAVGRPAADLLGGRGPGAPSPQRRHLRAPCRLSRGGPPHPGDLRGLGLPHRRLRTRR